MWYAIEGYDGSAMCCPGGWRRGPPTWPAAGSARRGRLLVAGPCPAIDAEDPDRPAFSGSLVIAEFASLEARAWADADPYVRRVYAPVEVRPVPQGCCRERRDRGRHPAPEPAAGRAHPPCSPRRCAQRLDIADDSHKHAGHAGSARAAGALQRGTSSARPSPASCRWPATGWSMPRWASMMQTDIHAPRRSGADARRTGSPDILRDRHPMSVAFPSIKSMVGGCNLPPS